MKKTAFFLFILFTAVQVLPTMHYLLDNEQAIALDITEEKKTDKDHVKAAKEFLPFYLLRLELSVNPDTRIHHTERIMPSPFFERLIPPPNFC